MLRTGLSLLATTVVALASACSPYVYGDEMATLKGSVDSLSKSVTNGLANYQSEIAARETRLLIDDRARMTMSEGCYVFDAKTPCKLQRTTAVARPNPKPLTAPYNEATHKHGLETTSALSHYVGGLAAVTNAKDREDFDKAAGKLTKSLKEMAKFADAVLPGASTGVEVIVDTVTWLIGQSLDYQRFRKLKEAVNVVGRPAAEGKTAPIESVAGAIEALLAMQITARQEVLFLEANILSSRLGPGLGEESYRRTLADAQAAVAAYDAVRRANAKAAPKGLVEAHKALLEAVNDSSRQRDKFLEALEAFGNHAAAIEAALSDLGKK